MRGKRLIFLIISSTLVMLIGCVRETNGIEPVESSQSTVQQEQLASNKLIEIEASNLLSDSISIEYPNVTSFIPKYLTDDLFVIAEILEDDVLYLGYMDRSTKEITKIKEIDRTSDLVSFIVHSSNQHYLFFEEFDQVYQTSRYYLFDFLTGKVSHIHSINDVVPIHYTQTTWSEQFLYFNCYDETTRDYLTYCYELSTGESEIIIDYNSATPVINGENLYFIGIDNSSLTTTIKSKNVASDKEESIAQIQSANQFFEGIYSNGEDFVTLLNNSGEKQLLLSDNSFDQKNPLYSSSWLETVIFKDRFVSFLSYPREEDRIRTQYYLIDVVNGINYRYDDSIILLSQKGILWVQFKKDEKLIPKGDIFNNDNSVMRLFLF